MKSLSGKVTFAAGRWTVRVANGIEIGSTLGSPTFESALAAVSLAVEGAIELGPVGDREEYEWSAKALEASAEGSAG